jgi:hypothetical protein
MWDEGAGPLWRDEGLLPDDPEWLREALGLSDSLIADLLAWVRYMDEARDRGQSQAPLDNRALQLTRRLQIEVGSRCGSDSTRSRCASGSAFGLVARLYAEYERPDLPRVCHKRRLVPSSTCRCSSDHTISGRQSVAALASYIACPVTLKLDTWLEFKASLWVRRPTGPDVVETPIKEQGSHSDRRTP